MMVWTYDARLSKFTGKERDTESGLDYFGARYYGSNTARFMSPDWANKAEPIPYSKLDDPQSLNLYAYVHNNPLNNVDVDGHDGQPLADPLGFTGDENIPAGKFPAGDAEAYSNYVARTGDAQQHDQAQAPKKGLGFWAHVGNLFSGHGWNYGTYKVSSRILEPSETQEPSPEAEDAKSNLGIYTDAAGILGDMMEAPFLGKVMGVISGGWPISEKLHRLGCPMSRF